MRGGGDRPRNAPPSPTSLTTPPQRPRLLPRILLRPPRPPDRHGQLRHNDGSPSRVPTRSPDRSDDILVTTTEYDSAGNAYKTIDPADREDRQEFDAAGRVTKTIQNYKDGAIDQDHQDEDVTVSMTYTSDGRVLTLTAANATTGDQVTHVRLRHDARRLRRGPRRPPAPEIYPDSDDTADPLGNGDDGIYDRVEHCYNRQGERTQKKDQNDTVHVYDYDLLGRPVEDHVTIRRRRHRRHRSSHQHGLRGTWHGRKDHQLR